MKSVLFFLVTLFSFHFNALALDVPSSIVGTMDDVYCGEMDPALVGDACIVFTKDESTGVNFGLVYPDYEWMSAHVPDTDSETDLIGDRFVASFCSKIYNKDKIGVLRDFKAGTYYLDCDFPAETFSWLYPSEYLTFAESSKLTQKRLVKYMLDEKVIYEGEDPVSALDSDDIKAMKIKCSDGNVYDSIVVYSGDTPHGPIYGMNSLIMVGVHGDGDTRLFGAGWIECNEL